MLTSPFGTCYTLGLLHRCKDRICRLPESEFGYDSRGRGGCCCKLADSESSGEALESRLRSPLNKLSDNITVHTNPCMPHPSQPVILPCLINSHMIQPLSIPASYFIILFLHALFVCHMKIFDRHSNTPVHVFYCSTALPLHGIILFPTLNSLLFLGCLI